MASRFKKRFLANYESEKQQHQAQSDPTLQQTHAADNTTQVIVSDACCQAALPLSMHLLQPSHTHGRHLILVYSADRPPATMQQQRPSSLLQMHHNSSSRSQHQHQPAPLQRTSSHSRHSRHKCRMHRSSSLASKQPQHSSSCLLQGPQALGPAQLMQHSSPAQPQQGMSAHSSNSSRPCSSRYSSQHWVQHYRQLRFQTFLRHLL